MKSPILPSIFVSFLFLFSVNATTSIPIREVELPSGVKAAVEKMYEVTRGESDCCGVSSVRIFRIGEKMDRREAVGEVLRLVAKQESSVDWLLRNPDEEGVVWVLRAPERSSLRNFLFSAISAFKGLSGQCDGATKELGEVLGTMEVDVLVYEEIFPSPNVDGNVEVAMTPDGKYLIVVVSDYGA
jgi:hypothetical protein